MPGRPRPKKSSNASRPQRMTSGTGNIQTSNYDLRNAKFGGGFAAEGGVQVGGQINISINANAEDAEKVTRLVMSLKELIKVFPDLEKEEAEFDLEILSEELQKEPEQQSEKRIRRYLKSLLAATGSTLVGVVAISEQFAAEMAAEQVKTVDKVNIAKNARLLAEEVRRIREDAVHYSMLSEMNRQLMESIDMFAENIGELSHILEASPE